MDTEVSGEHLAQLRPGTAPFLEVENLTVSYAARRRRGGRSDRVLAVDHVSFDIRRGAVLGIAGESGSGKSTIAKAVGRLIDPDEGRITLDGVDLRALHGEPLRRLRKQFQFVFQDPYASLNRRMTIEQLIAEPLQAHGIGSASDRHRRVAELLADVGLPVEWRGRYPRALSGGQRQRVAIARALALKPKLLICDEPISALDVSIQAQIVNLLKDLQLSLGLTMIFISHDLSMMRYLADEIVVMTRGVLVERAETLELFANAANPYTRRLLASIPGNHDRDLPGALLSLADVEKCGAPDASGMVEVRPGHRVSVHRWEGEAASLDRA
jgi:ABC-type glutathione transport system ATPase component